MGLKRGERGIISGSVCGAPARFHLIVSFLRGLYAVLIRSYNLAADSA